jgi:hypothetical protein
MSVDPQCSVPSLGVTLIRSEDFERRFSQAAEKGEDATDETTAAHVGTTSAWAFTLLVCVALLCAALWA